MEKPPIAKVGLRYQDIIVLELQGRRCWCQCKCGDIYKGWTYKLSTRCYKCFVKNGCNLKSHGLSKTPEYQSWQSMKDRCFNKNNLSYKNYGGRGITVCDRWQGKDGFINFKEDVGKRPSLGHSLDRINNDDHYTPENCKWSTRKEQLSNRRQGDAVYRTHKKICTICSKKYMGYHKNLYCNRTCQNKAYRNRKKLSSVSSPAAT